MPASLGIADLASETLIRIFINLSFQDIISCKLVCKRFNREIDELIAVQYKFECDICGVIDWDTNAFTVTERLQRLRDQQEAWVSGVPSEVFHVQSSHQAFGSVVTALAAAKNGRQTLHITQIPSKYRNIPKKEWELDLSFVVSAFTIDQSQRLLIAVERVQPTQGITNRKRFHVLDSETGRPHSLAVSASFDVEGRMHSKMITSGDMCGALFTSNVDGVVKDTLRVWNWKTVDLLLDFTVFEVTAFAIIEGPYVLLGLRPSATEPSTICVLPCSSDKPIGREDVHQTAVLELGLPIKSPRDTVHISLDTPQLPPHDTAAPFVSDPKRRFIHIQAHIYNPIPNAPVGLVHSADYFVPLQNIQALLQMKDEFQASNVASRTRRVYTWSQWSQRAIMNELWDPGEPGRRYTEIVDHRGPRVFVDRPAWIPPDMPLNIYRTILDLNSYWARRRSHARSQVVEDGLIDDTFQDVTSILPSHLGDIIPLQHDWAARLKPAFRRDALLDDGIVVEEDLEHRGSRQHGMCLVWAF